MMLRDFASGCAVARGDRILEGCAPAILERIWSDLPERRARLGIGLHRLAWTQDAIQAFINGDLSSRRRDVGSRPLRGGRGILHRPG